jgi:hypothetical protein
MEGQVGCVVQVGARQMLDLDVDSCDLAPPPVNRQDSSQRVIDSSLEADLRRNENNRGPAWVLVRFTCVRPDPDRFD